MVPNPTLRNIIFDDVLHNDTKRDTKIIGDADNLTMITAANDKDTLVNEVNFRTFNLWIRRNRLRIATIDIEPQRTVRYLFKTQRSFEMHILYAKKSG